MTNKMIINRINRNLNKQIFKKINKNSNQIYKTLIYKCYQVQESLQIKILKNILKKIKI